jgi:hypothetical protein
MVKWYKETEGLGVRVIKKLHNFSSLNPNPKILTPVIQNPGKADISS